MKESCVRSIGVHKMFFIRSSFVFLLASASALFAATAPTSVTGTAASCTSVTVSWPAASGTGNNAPAQYDVYRGNSSTLIGTVNSPTVTFTDSAAGAYSSHTYGVRTRDKGGNNSTITWSTTVPTAPQCPGPGAPQNVSAATPSCTQVTLSWTAPSQTGSGLVGYRIYRNNVYVSQVTGVSYSNSGLAQSTTYNYDVSAMDSSGRESAKTRVVVTTPSCQQPGPNAGPPGAANMTMHGNASAINWPGTAGVRYQAERSTDFGLTWNPVDAPTTSFGVTNVRVGAVAVYRVAWFTNTAEYRNNYTLFSSDVTAPTAISSITQTEIAPNQIRLDWSASGDTQSGLKGYLLYRDDAFLAFTPNGVTTYTDTTGEGSTSAYDIAAMDRAGNVTAKVRPGGCTFSLSVGGWTAPACAGGTSIYVTASRNNCDWTVSNPCSWLSVSPGGGSGSGWVNISAASNTTGSPRSCTLTIAGQSFSVTQSACVCNYTISTSAAPAAGGSTSGGGTVNCGSSATVTATANAGYTFAYWTENGGLVSSSASYTFTANANRNLVANFTANPCSYSLVPSSSSFGNAGGSGSFIVYTTSTCSRNATPSDTWITVTSGGTGTGNGTVYFSVAANSGAARSGTISISGQNYTVYQDAAATCTYSLTPNNVYFSSASASGGSIVTAGGGCSWTATALDGWINITSGGSGTGSDSITYSVNANPSVALDRVGSIRVTGGSSTYILTVNQDRNYAPLANAGPNSSSPVGAPVTMDGSASTDEDGRIVSYAWNYGDGTTGSGVSGSHAYAAAGNYTVTLTATDDLGASASASKVLTITSTPTATLPWVDTSISSDTIDSGEATTVDSAGNMIVGGTLNSSFFLTKYSASGAKLWQRIFYGTIVPQGMTTDASGNIYVTGYYLGSQNLGGSVLTGSLSVQYMFIAKYSAAGDHIWSQGFGGMAGNTSGKGIVLDSSGNIFVAGLFGSVNFGGGLLSGNSGGSAFVASFSGSNGAHRWSKQFGISFARVNGIAIDRSSGALYVTGVYLGTLDLGGITLTAPLANQYSGFIAKLSSTGGHVWSRSFGGFANNSYGYGGNGIGVSPDGEVFITGTFFGSMNLGGNTLTSKTDSYFDIFFARFSSNGDHRWSSRVSTSISSSGWGLAAASDSQGNMLFTGRVYGVADFGNGVTVSSTGINTFVSKYSSTGACVWAKTYAGNNQGHSIGSDPSGNVVVTGKWSGTTDFGDGVVRSSVAGGMDTYILKLAP